MQKKTVSGLLSTLLLLSMLTLAFNIQPVGASGTIYIRPDGSVEGTDKIERDGDVYTFTDNIYDGIVVERDNIVVDGAGYTQQGTGSGHGIYLSGRSNVTIKNIEIQAFSFCIALREASDNTISGNNITNNVIGIWLWSYSNYNNISGNHITANNWDGIYLHWSSNNVIAGNNITNNGAGICLDEFSSYNNIIGNIIANNPEGIPFVWYSDYNNVSENHITANNIGVTIYESSNNVFYHNNFISNTQQVQFIGANFWDDGYPSGGNYWSDHVTVDDYSGVNQDELWSDGIVDEPYIIDYYNRDHYPLVEPWSPVIHATIDIDPNTLHLMSQAQWITCYIELPEGYNVSDIDVSTVMLNDTIPVALLDVPAPDPVPTEIGDYDNDTIPDLMVKFDSAMVSEFILSQGITDDVVTLAITGEVNGTPFKGTDTIRVLMGGGGGAGARAKVIA